MIKNSTIAFCSAIVLVFACTNLASAQSAVPNAKPPSQFELSIQQGIADQTAIIDRIKEDLDRIQMRRDVTAKKLAEIQSVENKSGVSIESFPEIVKNLQAKRIDLMIDLAGLEARRDAILSAKSSKIDQSSITEPLKQLIALKQNKLDRLRKTTASDDDKRTVEMELLSAKVQLARAKSNQSGSNLLSDSLLSTSLELAESKARLSKTDALLAKVLPARKQFESSELLKEETIRFKKEEARLSNSLRENQRTIERFKGQLERLKGEEHRP